MNNDEFDMKEMKEKEKKKSKHRNNVRTSFLSYFFIFTSSHRLRCWFLQTSQTSPTINPLPIC